MREVAPQLTSYERRALAEPGIPPAGLSYALYDEMQSDSMIQTALTVKRLGVLAAPWKIVPYDDSRKAQDRANFIEKCFSEMEGSPHTILDAAMDAFAKGWSVQELVYELRGASIGLVAVRPKNPAVFGLDLDSFGRIEGLKLRLAGEPAQNLPRSKFIIYRYRGGYGSPQGRSDLNAAYRHWHSKQTLLKAWRLHLERFAMPTVLAKFARGMPSTELSSLTSSLNNLHSVTSILYPEEASIHTIGGEKESSTGFMEAIDFHNREIARSILGQTLTTDEGRRVGSLALGKVHLQVFLLQLQSLRRELADVVMTEQVIRPLIELNFGSGQVPRFEFEGSAAESFVSGAL